MEQYKDVLGTIFSYLVEAFGVYLGSSLHVPVHTKMSKKRFPKSIIMVISAKRNLFLMHQLCLKIMGKKEFKKNTEKDLL